MLQLCLESFRDSYLRGKARSLQWPMRTYLIFSLPPPTSTPCWTSDLFISAPKTCTRPLLSHYACWFHSLEYSSFEFPPDSLPHFLQVFIYMSYGKLGLVQQSVHTHMQTHMHVCTHILPIPSTFCHSAHIYCKITENINFLSAPHSWHRAPKTLIIP